jgi:hypothetical protein
MKRSGHCECGAVAFDVIGARDTVSFCHCSQCRRLTGHHFAATKVKEADLTYTQNSGLKWYASSDWAKRGFCGECGSSLFYKAIDSDDINIAAGSFPNPTGLKPGRHIFCADKGDYYEIANDAPHIEKY